MAVHKPGYILLLVLSWLVFVAVVIFAIFAQYDRSHFGAGLFQNGWPDFWKFKATDLVPTWWTFAIWDAIYLYEFLWLIYASTTFGRKDEEEDEYIYTVGPFIHWTFYFFFILATGGEIASLFLYDRQHYLIHVTCLAAAVLILRAIVLIIPTIGIFKYREEMVDAGIPNEYKLVIGFIQNGVGLGVSWCAIQFTIVLSMLLQFETNLKNSDNGVTVALAVFTCMLVLLTICDLGFFEKWTRFLITPYLVNVFGLSGMLVRHYSPKEKNMIFLTTLLAVACLLLVIKVILAIVRERRKPLFYGTKDNDSEYGSEASDAGSVASKVSEVSEKEGQDNPYYN